MGGGVHKTSIVPEPAENCDLSHSSLDAVGTDCVSLSLHPPQRAVAHITGSHITSGLELETLPMCAGRQVIAVVHHSPTRVSRH